MSQASYIIGIDLGTTNSTIAYTLLHSDNALQPELLMASIGNFIQFLSE